MLVLKAQHSKKMETNQDSLAISQALEDYYFKGIYEGDVNTLARILNPGTLLFGDVKGSLMPKRSISTSMVLPTGKARRIPANLLKERSSLSMWLIR
jgi:hypothetical protein